MRRKPKHTNQAKAALALTTALTLACTSLIGCTASPETGTGKEGQTANVDSDASLYPTEAVEFPIYIEPIEGISDDFIRGVDASEVLAIENSGAKYYDTNGQETDVFKVLADSGVNWVRLRIWNDPYDENGNGYGGGNCDVPTAVTLGKRATDNGLKVLIDFHYSDFWADPSRQLVPKAWKDMDIDTKCEAVHDFTYDALKQLTDAGVDVEMIQVGNETNNGLAGEIELKKIVSMMSAGSKAAREISTETGNEIKVAVHYANPEDTAGILKKAKRLGEIGLDYDVFGLSYYPYWHCKLDVIEDLAKTIRETYHVDVMIAETAYPFTAGDGDGNANSYGGDAMTWGYEASVQGQSSMLRDVCKMANDAGTLGVFYWGGTWIPVGSDYETNFPIWEKYGSGWASSFAVSYDKKNVGDYYGGSAWDNQALFGFDGHPLDSLQTFKYLGCGTISDSRPVEIVPYVFDETGNALKNASFEDSDISMWEVTYEGGNPTDFQEKTADAHSGDFSFHFWSQSDMDFTIQQTVTGLEEGTYKASVFSQGGDLNETSVLEFFVLSDGFEERINFEDAGWAVWQNPEITGIPVSSDGTVTVGVHVIANKNGWGTFDDFSLVLE